MSAGTDIAVIENQRALVAFLNDPKYQQEMELALPEGYSLPKFIRAMQTALLENPDILQADRVSLYKAGLKAASDGLIPDGKEAAFVIYKGNVGYLPMIQGVRKMLAEYGWSIRTEVIWSNDNFKHDAAEAKVFHHWRVGEERGERIGAYALGVHKDGRRELVVYDYHQIEDVRVKSSQTDKFWKKWPNQMWEKTVAHRLAKKLPLDPKDKERILNALADIEGSAVDVVYGRDAALDPPSERRALPGADGRQASPPSSAPPQADPKPGPVEETQRSSEEGDGAAAATAEDDPLQEPTDEELDAMSEPETVEGHAVEEGDEPRFDEGKHEGKTIQEVYDSGPRGQNYVNWAVSHWNREPMRTALRKWHDEHGQSS